MKRRVLISLARTVLAAPGKPRAIDVLSRIEVPASRDSAANARNGRITAAGARDSNGFRHEPRVQIVNDGRLPRRSARRLRRGTPGGRR